MTALTSTLKRQLFLLILAPILGLLALLLVHLLPTIPMEQHVYWSMDMIEKEFTDELVIDGYKSTMTGNFTDCLMLQYAIYSNENHNILEQTLRMYRSESYYDESNPEGWWPGRSLKDYLEDVPQAREVEYSRYWHGYLVILKPLLLLTSVNTIRLLNSAVQLILIAFVLMELCKRNAYSLARAFVVSLPFMFFVSTYASLSLCICFYLMIIALLIQVKWDDRLFERNLYNEFFLLVGIATSFFDFLTYPLVTLAYPLCIYLFFHGKGLGYNVKKIIQNSLEWFVGYIGMWSAKWILTDLLTDSTTIRDALSAVLTRTQSAENSSHLEGFLQVITLNLQPFLNWCYFLIALGILFFILMHLKKTTLKNVLANAANGAVFFLIALFPFVWYFVTQNHSFEHWQFTCRLLAITAFAAIIGIQKMLEP